MRKEHVSHRHRQQQSQLARASAYISSREADGAHTLGEGARGCKVRSRIVIREHKWCGPITVRAIWLVCIREVTLSFSEQLSKLEGPSCGHLLPSQTPLANQEVFLVLTSEEQPQARLSTKLQQLWSPLPICASNAVKEQWGFPSPGIHLEIPLHYPVFQGSFTWVSLKGIRCIF